MVESLPKYNKISETFANLAKEDDFLKALESFIYIYKEERQKNDTPSIPLALFSNRKLGTLEIMVKYLKENLGLNYSEIAKLINRDDRTVWTTYQKAVKKQKEKFQTKKEEQSIPCNAFYERKQGPLESLVTYLKENLGLSFKQISQILNRDYTTIWLSYKKGKEKKKAQ